MANQIQNPEARAMLDAAGLTLPDLGNLTGKSVAHMSRWWPRNGPLRIPSAERNLIRAFGMLGQNDRAALLATGGSAEK